MQQKVLVCIAVAAFGYLLINSFLPEIKGMDAGHVVLLLALGSGLVVLGQIDSY